MIDCVAIGDQIAAGVGSNLKCEIRAAPNLTSSRIIDIANGNGNYHKICIISAGTYDSGYKTYANLKRIRDVSICKFYVWILPTDANKSKIVDDVAHSEHDEVVGFTPQSSPNQQLPYSYGSLATTIQNLKEVK